MSNYFAKDLCKDLEDRRVYMPDGYIMKWYKVDIPVAWVSQHPTVLLTIKQRTNGLFYLSNSSVRFGNKDDAIMFALCYKDDRAR